jgi:hypothetical protein
MIAQRFNVSVKIQQEISPGGTAEIVPVVERADNQPSLRG